MIRKLYRKMYRALRINRKQGIIYQILPESALERRDAYYQRLAAEDPESAERMISILERKAK